VVEADELHRFRRAFEAIAQGDLDAAAGIVSADFVIDDHTVPEDTTIVRGPAAFGALLSRLREAFDDYRVELRELEELDDGRIYAVVRTFGRGRGSGIELEGDVGQIWTLRDGLVVRNDVYPTPAEARRAAGLEV
jgi:ketosteroid isomerase-like protein